MDPPPLPSHPPPPTTTPAAVPATVTTQLSHPDSANSSPRSRHAADTWVDESHLPLVPGAKLRLMCSYGGHIIPRPHDKSLCYVGGDTRMVVVNRHSSLSSLSSRLSRTLFGGRHFTLKYQLPNEDLDSLISVTTDEDLDNMIEEYDRIAAAAPPLKPAGRLRLRLFLFLAKPETAASMGSLLDDAKSETWFVDALNGTGFLPRGLSESAAMDSLLELDDGDGNFHTDSRPDVDLEAEKLGKNANAHNVLALMPDSPMVETNSSYGSSSSSPSMSNLPSIRVRVEDGGGGARFQDQMVGLDEQFLHMNVAPPPLPTVIGGGAAALSGGGAGSAAVSDEERSDQGAPAGFRKPPLPLQPVPRKVVDGYGLPSPDSKLAAGGGFSLPSPDSVASDSSIASATSTSKHTVYQEPAHVAATETRAPPIPLDPECNNISDASPQIQMQQLHESAYMLPPQQIHQQQQQFVHTNKHYIHHQHHPGQVPVSSYYQMYAAPQPPQQQQQQLHHHHHHQQIDQQYPMYFYPVTQTLPPNSTTPTATPTPSPIYNETNPPIYLTNTATAAKPEMSQMTTSPPVQVPSNQFQQQYMGVSHMQHHPSQSINIAAANYGFDPYPHHQTHDQVYYAQHQAAPMAMPPQYQTMSPAATTVFLSSQAASPQLAEDNTSQQIRPS